jgi:ABC-2 type transport system ATP-binding protein
MGGAGQRYAIEARNVWKSYDDEVVLEDLSLGVKHGEILALMGRNGAGKSTFMSCIAGSEPVDSGTISVYGTTEYEERGRNIAVLFQDALLIDNLTGWENFDFYSSIEDLNQTRFEEYVDRFELTDDLEKPTKSYSGGMKRKLELSITLSATADCYLVDEPTAGVDLSMVGEIHRTLIELAERGSTILLSSHQPIDIEIADRVAFLVNRSISHVDVPSSLGDNLPPVIRLPNLESAEAAREYVGALYQVGSERRAFLDGTDLQTIQKVVEHETGFGDEVQQTRAGYSDAFKYYTGADE